MGNMHYNYLSHVPLAIKDGQIVAFVESDGLLYYVSGNTLTDIDYAESVLAYILNLGVRERVYFEQVNIEKARPVLEAIVLDFNIEGDFVRRNFNFADRLINYAHHYFDPVKQPEQGLRRPSLA